MNGAMSLGKKPSNPPPIPAAPPRRHHKWPWITLGVIVLLVLFVVGYTGYGQVPVLANIFGSTKPKDLGIHPTEADWFKVSTTVPIQVNGDAGSYSVFGSKVFTGSVMSSTELTSAEITAWIQHYTTNDPYVRDIQVKFIPGGMEISAFAKRYLNTPIYVKVMVDRTGTNSVNLDVQKASLGKMPVPGNYIKKFNDYAQKILNEHLAAIPGFSIEQLEYKDGSRVFKGTYPASISTASGSWW